jgi:hypothetical protein
VKKLDYGQLQPLSKNIAVNKQNLASENELCMNELEKYINNFRTYMSNLCVYDMTSLLIAEQDWLLRNAKTTTQPYSLVGKMLKVDFGKVYQYENGFVHYALCVAEQNNKYFVAPSTTSSKAVKAAFHPKYRPAGEKRIYLLKKEDNVDKDAALYLNDMRYVSGGRILQVGNIINKDILYSVINHIIYLCFPHISSEIMEQKNKYDDLRRRFDALEARCELLQESNGLYKAIVEASKKDIG